MMRLNLLPDYKYLMGLPADKLDQEDQVVRIEPRFRRFFGRATAVITGLNRNQGRWTVVEVAGNYYLNGYYLSKVKGIPVFRGN